MPDDRDQLVDIWRRSAGATHHFVSTPELEALLPEVRALRLESLHTWVLCSPDSEAIGFLVMEGRAVEALVIAPEWRRHGGGARLMQQARSLAERLTVEVNEQNADALAFYLSMGFEIVGRTRTDRSGRAHPLLFLEESESATHASPARGCVL